jgi:5-aminolevulinate synthase
MANDVLVENNSWHDYFKKGLTRLRETGEYRVFRNIERLQTGEGDWQTRFENEEILNFCSNDYLAMTMHPAVVEAALVTVRTCGVGAGGSRNIGGTHTVHSALERELADLHSRERGLLFTSGYLANYVPVLTLGSQIPDVIFYSDEMNHASMIDAMGAVTRDRKLNCDKRIFRHNDVADLERLLAADDPDRPKVIVFESLYSMEADRAPVQELCRLGKKYNAHGSRPRTGTGTMPTGKKVQRFNISE